MSRRSAAGCCYWLLLEDEWDDDEKLMHLDRADGLMVWLPAAAHRGGRRIEARVRISALIPCQNQ